MLNRVRGDADAMQKRVKQTGLELLGSIPEDENITRFDMEARPLLQLPEDSPASIAAGNILAKI